jgi:hypothetical protein
MKSSVVKFFVCFVSIGLLQSCVGIALKSIGAHASSAELRILKSKTKTVCFIPMHHVGKKVFYDDVHRISDSLGRLGYVAFYEGVDTRLKDSLALDLLKRKWRKMMGFYLDKSGYIDSNHRFMGRYKLSKKYVNQPQAETLIAASTQPENVDVTMEDLFGAFEKRVAPIELETCDMAIALDSLYKGCQPLRVTAQKQYNIFQDDFILKYRNQHVAHAIQHHENQKIIVIYGSGHFKGLLEELKAIDSTWQKENLK